MDPVSQEQAAAAEARGSQGVSGGGGRSTVPPLHAALDGALNTYVAMKSGSRQGAPPPPAAATPTASPTPRVHTFTLASVLNTFAVMKYGSRKMDN